MRMRELAFVALLGGALMATGCGNDDNGSGGTPATTCPIELGEQEALYTVVCTTQLGPVTIGFRLFAANGEVPLIVDEPVSVSTCAQLEVDQELLNQLEIVGIDPIVEVGSVGLGTTNATSPGIEHVIPDAPVGLALTTATDTVNTDVTALSEGVVNIEPTAAQIAVDLGGVEPLIIDVGVEPCGGFILDGEPIGFDAALTPP